MSKKLNHTNIRMILIQNISPCHHKQLDKPLHHEKETTIMQPKRFTIEHAGKFTTVNGQSAATIGAAYLHATRISYEIITPTTTIIRNWHTQEQVTITEL